MLEYALEMTNSQECLNRKLIYYMQYEAPVFPFPGVAVASKWRTPESSRSFQHCSIMRQVKLYIRLYTVYERQWEGQREPLVYLANVVCSCDTAIDKLGTQNCHTLGAKLISRSGRKGHDMTRHISSGTKLCFTSMDKQTVRITGADLQKNPIL